MNQRVWIDGVFDLIQPGHFNLLRLAQLSGGAEVVVGLCTDHDAKENTGSKPVLTLAERSGVVRACRWVTECIPGVPYQTLVSTLDDNKCAVSVHGKYAIDSYSEVREAKRELEIRQNEAIATQDIIGRLLLGTKRHHVDWKAIVWQENDVLAGFALSGGPNICVYDEEKGIAQSVFPFTKPGISSNKRVYVDGGFDLLHAGHVSFLKQASESIDGAYCGVVVGLLGDGEINQIKGSNHPIQNISERLLAIASIRGVECVLIGAPKVVTEALLQSVGASKVVYGASGSPYDSGDEVVWDPYSELRSKDSVRSLDVHDFNSLTTTTILSRIISRHLDQVHQITAAEQHGGQMWQTVENLIDDFSLTCNSLGPPPKAMKHVQDVLKMIQHYPPDTQEPGFSALLGFMRPGYDSTFRNRVLLGNGASELIDLIIRTAPPGGFLRPAWEAQFMEYERSAKAMGREIMDPHSKETNRSFGVMAIVNPCNPSGDYFERDALMNYIEDSTKACSSCTVIVDESMLFWHGPNWRAQTLANDCDEWIMNMKSQSVNVFVIHSWTKIWTIPGLRIGSLIAPTSSDAQFIKNIMVPWSVNILAIEFVGVASGEVEYMESTWSNTKLWREQFVKKLTAIHPDWTVSGEPWLSWCWIDTHSEAEQKLAVSNCLAGGCPVRDGMVGYKLPTCFRVSVRCAEQHEHVINALK